MTTNIELEKSFYKEILENEIEIAILPWGSTEAHNYHLPYSSDNIHSKYVAVESAKIAFQSGARIIVLPGIPYGVNTGQLEIKLDINLNPSTQFAILNDITFSLVKHKIKKLVILNGHGGNDFKQIIRELQVKYPEIFLCTINWWQVYNDKEYFNEPGDHAGEMETSVMMYIAPDKIKNISVAGNGKEYKFKIQGLKEKWVWAQRQWSKASRDTGIGNPKNASAEKGKIFIESIINKIATFLIELDKTELKDLYEK